jgi:hypothetical protein
LKDLKVAYDHKLHYNTQTYTLSPELIEKLPLPGGLANTGTVYGFVEDDISFGRRLFAMQKADGNRRKHSLGLGCRH